MSDYRVADGHDVALGSLTVLNPQPRSPGIQYTRQQFGGDGAPVNEGPFVLLIWSVVSNAAYDQIMTDFGLTSADSNDVTVYVRDENWDYVRKNGKAIKPRIGDERTWNIFPRDVVILVRGLEDAA